ncbi:hypothetical protein [Thermovenabulum sp.]|uniref:hypothetical protein n=2 Tax=Thermovenabulum sp. TaxID=3100335 RepID=UPI003C7DEFFD
MKNSNNPVLEILESLENALSKLNIPEKRKEKISKDIAAQKQRYEKINQEEIAGEEKKKVYQGITVKGKDLLEKLKSKNIDSKEKEKYILSFLLYIRAAYFDFKDQLKPLNTGIRLFALTSALFIGLSPQFLGGAFSLLFLVPIFLGLNGLKRRRIFGFKMAMMIFPVALGVAALWIRFGINAVLNFQKVVFDTAHTLGKPVNIAKFFVIVPPVFALVLLASSFIMAYYLYKSREMLL